MVNFIFKLFTTLFVFLFVSLTAIAAEITATVDRNPIPVGESFRFILDARGSIDEEPDFSELQKKFRIVNTSQSSNFRLINGSITRNKTWTMVLMIDEAGSYTIPAVKFGKDKSDPINIDVVTNKVKQNNNQNADLFLEIDISPKSVYVQQQLIYTIKLFHRIRLSNASLSEPVSVNNQALISKLGDDTQSKTAINGIGYSVIERRYAVFPQKSGKLKINPVQFETQIVRNRRQHSFFTADPFNSQGTIKRIKSKAVEIQVKSIPAAFTKKYPDAAWLPVENMIIKESWSGDINSFKSGEPMTRTINLTAQNLSAAQLPNIEFITPKNVNAYPDVPVVKEETNSKGLTAGKQFKMALLPTKTGDYKLPKIIIPWWNTTTNTIHESTLPAHKIHVVAAPGQNDNNNLKLNDELSGKQLNKTDINKTKNVVLEPLDKKQILNSVSSVWFIISILFIALWLVTFYLLLRLRSKFNDLISDSKNEKTATTVSTKEIKKACARNDAQACSQLLVQWANSKTESAQFTSLSSLLPYVDNDLHQLIEELELSLYSKKSQDWDGSKIWLAFKSTPPIFTKNTKQKSKNPGLASLYANYE